MSIEEDIKALLPENVYKVTVKEKTLVGNTYLNTVVYYKDKAGKNWYLDLFNGAGSTAEAIATEANTLMGSRNVTEENIDTWEGEGGNGHARWN